MTYTKTFPNGPAMRSFMRLKLGGRKGVKIDESKFDKEKKVYVLTYHFEK